MTPDEIKSAITGWSNQGTALQLVEDRSEPGADFVLGLRSASHGSAGTVPVEVRLDQGADRLTVTSTSTSSARRRTRSARSSTAAPRRCTRRHLRRPAR